MSPLCSRNISNRATFAGARWSDGAGALAIWSSPFRRSSVRLRGRVRCNLGPARLGNGQNSNAICSTSQAGASQEPETVHSPTFPLTSVGRHGRKTEVFHSAVRAPRPTARPSFGTLEVLSPPRDALRSGLQLLGGLDPAYPLVARERSDVFPGRHRFGMRDKSNPKVCGQFVDHPARHLCFPAHRADDLTRRSRAVD